VDVQETETVGDLIAEVAQDLEEISKSWIMVVSIICLILTFGSAGLASEGLLSLGGWHSLDSLGQLSESYKVHAAFWGLHFPPLCRECGCFPI
jgi:hypothetical protein